MSLLFVRDKRFVQIPRPTLSSKQSSLCFVLQLCKTSHCRLLFLFPNTHIVRIWMPLERDATPSAPRGRTNFLAKHKRVEPSCPCQKTTSFDRNLSFSTKSTLAGERNIASQCEIRLRRVKFASTASGWI